MLKLVIANKCYSSWSFRPWLLLTEFGIPFEEVQIPFGPTFGDPVWLRAISPSPRRARCRPCSTGMCRCGNRWR